MEKVKGNTQEKAKKYTILSRDDVKLWILD